MKTYLLTDNYLKHGPTTQRVKSLSFEALVAYLREKDVVTLTKETLQRIHTKAVCLHGSPKGMVAPESVNARVFLAAYMVAYRPTNVFEDMGKLEKELLQAAVPLVETFEAIVTAVVESKKKSFSDIAPELTAGFTMMLYKYLQCFKAWKVPDEAKLTGRIKHALTALYEAQSMLPPTRLEEDAKLKEEFAAQISRLETKLAMIAGKPCLDEFKAIPVVTRPATLIEDRMTNEQLAHELLMDPAFQLSDDGCGNMLHRNIRESFQR